MGFYFENHQSMFAHAGMQVEKTLEGIIRRYLGLNPPHPPTFRAYNRSGILRGQDYRYHADFTRIFPEATDGQYVYAWAKIWSDGATEIKFDVSCRSPLVIFRNGECLFRSNIFNERYADQRTSLTIALQAGWNHFVLQFKKTRAGFGGVFGTWLGKLPYYFLMPTADRDGQEGWIFTEPLAAELPAIPGAGTTEQATGLRWQPRREWSAEKNGQGQLQRIFGVAPGASAIGWTKALFPRPGVAEYGLSGRNLTALTVYLDDEAVFSARTPGPFAAAIPVPFGWHDLMVKADGRGGDWGFELRVKDRDEELPFSSPCNLVGSSQPWIYTGAFAAGAEPRLGDLRDLKKLAAGATGPTYWRLDAPNEWVRPYNDNALFGKWNYPLGVTLSGLLHSARAIGSGEAQQYVVDHVQLSCDLFDYAMWDKEQYGGATNVHHLLTSLDSLDDCGSFGSMLLEVARHAEIRGHREIADLVADYIAQKQIRLPDGTFFRKNLMHTFHEDTMWADDLYMSVPFLCRYYQLTGATKYIDDAARQFLGFKQHLFIPELKAMSHVYDFTRQMATGIPWGRGNGWVIFSLSELLAVLPADHALRPVLLDFFRELSAGYLAMQDESGMWHQVLNEPDSYPETSCTSMFACAFARGVQSGWLPEAESYVRAVFKAWEALNRTSVDQFGNVHGVCRGSEFSFTSDYYKHELLWNLNDTHGIGIVLLAGVEVLRLMQHLQGAPAGGNGDRPAPAAREKSSGGPRARALAGAPR